MKQTPLPLYDVANLPPGEYHTYRKRSLTRAIRIDGRFQVETTEGLTTCEDGYLAIDARGYPYPIAADEFALIYERATE